MSSGESITSKLEQIDQVARLQEIAELGRKTIDFSEEHHATIFDATSLGISVEGAKLYEQAGLLDQLVRIS